MKALKVILLVIIFVALVAGLVGLQAAADGLALLRPAPYIAALERGGAFEEFPEILVGAFADDSSALPESERAKVEAAIRSAADPAWVKSELSGLLDEVAGFLTGRRPELSGSIPVDEFGERFISAYAETANPYILAQIKANTRELFAAPLPLAEFLTGDAFTAATGYVRLGLRVAAIVAGVWAVLVALTFLLAGGFVGGARWLGVACLVAGLIVLMGSFAAGGLLPGLLAGVDLAGVAPGAAQMAQEPVTSLAASVLGTIRLVSSVVAGLGLLLLVAAGLVASARSRRKVSPPAAAAPDPAPAAKVC